MNNSISNNKIDNQRLNKMISNNYNRNMIYKPNMAFINVNNFDEHSLNPITNRKIILNNKNPCHNFEYIKKASISSNNINNKEYYSVSIGKINKKFENKKVTCI